MITRHIGTSLIVAIVTIIAATSASADYLLVEAPSDVVAKLVCRKRGRAGICTDEIRVKPGTKLRFRGFFKAVGAAG